MAKRRAGRPSGRAAIYARFSSHNQRDESIEIQVENCRRYCEERGLKVVGEYCDHAQTGRDTNRAEFQRMLRDAEAGLFAHVVIYKVTRIMRNRDEMALLRMRLGKAGVGILYAGEQIAEGSSGVLQLGMLEVLAEWESALMGERIRDGIRKNAERCMANGQTIFGWDIGEDGRYVVNEREADALRDARAFVMSGGTVEDAARAMRSFLGRRGAPITGKRLAKMLRRPQNYGTYSYAGVTVEGGIPAIWSRAEHERLVDAMDGCGTKPKRKDGHEWFPLTGRMLHVHADGSLHPMRGYCGTSKSGRRYHYYQCKGCRRLVRKEEIEDRVAGSVLALLADAMTRERVADLVCDESAWADDGPSQVEVIREELEGIERAYSNIWAAIEAGVAPPGGKERVDALKERQAVLEAELADAEVLAGVELDRAAVLHWLEHASECGPGQLISLFVSRAYLHEDGALEVVCLFDEDPPPPPGTRLSGCSADGSQAPPAQPKPLQRGFFLFENPVPAKN